MTYKKNGRAIINNEVVDIMLPAQEKYVFDFSRYKRIIHHPWPKEKGFDKVICSNAETNRIWLDKPELREYKKFWAKAVGYETGNGSDEATDSYKLVTMDFDILQDAKMVYSHNDLEGILDQLNISTITPFLEPDFFNLKSSGEKISMEVVQMKNTTGRTAAFEKPVTINGQKYILEVKGVNFGDYAIELENDYYDGGECAGGLPVARMDNSIDILRKLNSNGYDSVVLVAAYEFPLKQFDGQKLGAYVRAVKSSPPLSHYDQNLHDVANSLNMLPENFAEYLISSMARDMAIIWRQGITHNWVHEQNVRITGISDFTGSAYVKDSGFNAVVTDAEMLVSTSQKITRKLIGPKIEYPTEEMYDTNPKKAERMDNLAELNQIKNQSELKCWTREIITRELNRQLGTRLPPVVGTTTLAAEIYAMQRDLGLTNPNEEIHIEHYKGLEDKDMDWKPLTLDDIRVPVR